MRTTGPPGTNEELPDGSKEEVTLDAQGNEIRIEAVATDASAAFAPFASEIAYDAAGQPVASTAPDDSHKGLTVDTSVDLLGRETASEAKRDGATTIATETTYNHLHWELVTTDANGVTTQTAYNVHGDPTSHTVGSKSVTYSYHATTGRLEGITDSDGTTVACTYDAFGNMTRELHEDSTGADLSDVVTTYDSLGRPLTEGDAVSGASRSWTYPLNQATTGTDETLSYGASAATTMTIDRSGRELETSRTATIASGKTVTRTVTARDAADRWTSATITPTGGTAKTTTRTFDAADRLTAQSGLGLASAAAYSYDANTGLLKGLSLPLSFGGALDESYSYYPGGRLAGATTAAGEAGYAFDEVGNLIRDEVAGVGTTTFTYDPASRLTRADHLPAEDGAGATSIHYGWDVENAWRTSQGGSPAPGAHEVQMTYSALGRMRTYSSAASGVSASYVYDAGGQRTRSAVTQGGATTTTTYAYEGLTLLRLSAVRGDASWKIEYLHDENDSPYGGVYRSPASSTASLYFSLVTNERGDVLALTDAAGAAFASYRYDAWGSPAGAETQATGLVGAALAAEIASRQVLRYAAYVFDAESGFYYCSARYYDPATRQWTTGDPAKDDGEESPYQYCAGNPAGASDPTGEWSIGNALRKAGDWARKSGLASAAHKAAMLAVPGYDVAYDLVKYKRFTWKSAVSLGTCFVPGGPVVRIAGKVAAKTIGKVAVKAAARYVAPVAKKAARAVVKKAGPAVRKTYCKVATKITKTPACFTAGTAVVTSAGWEQIEDLDPGESVLARSETGAVGSRQVLRAYESETDALVRLSLAGESLETTPSHPFWVAGRGWTAAGALAPGDELRLASGRSATLVATQRLTLTEPATVYNLEVAVDHTYFVGQVGVWVHNRCGGTNSAGSGAGASKQVTNPWGRRGSPAHRARIAAAEKRLNDRGWKTVSGGSKKESKFGGRYPDLVVANNNRHVAVQVGKATKRTKTPIARERRAIRDLRATRSFNHVFFLRYK